MPLSEDEQRILTEIEHQLRASDPELARHVGETTVYSAPLRHTQWAVVGVVVGLVLTMVLLNATNAYLAFFLGFLPTLASAVVLERGIRHLGRVGIEQLSTTVRLTGMRETFGPGAAHRSPRPDPRRDRRGDSPGDGGGTSDHDDD